MTLPVFYSPEAQAQQQARRSTIEEAASVEIADRYIEALLDRCEALGRFSDRGTPRNDLRPGIRTVAYRRRATIAYVVRSDRVIILAIRLCGPRTKRIARRAVNESSAPFDIALPNP